ncbi:MAG: SAM hydrolase/SAM-dependent halogenase family protein [Gammaproteobacteria bacterium]
MSVKFNASGVVTLTTDFGHRGSFIGVMKGVMLTRAPSLKIVDLTHEVLVHWPAEAGFWLHRSFGYFPPGTVHLAVVDPGVGTDRSVLVVEAAGHVFIGPDNGLLAEVIESYDSKTIRVSEAALKKFALANISATFHGRDIFAPIAAEIASGKIQISDLGVEVSDYIPSLIDPPEMMGGQVRGVVITSDNFGNLITNIEANLTQLFKAPRIHAGGHKISVSRTYGDVSPGELLCLINSSGVLEIACAEQSAEEALNIGRGSPVVVDEQD